MSFQRGDVVLLDYPFTSGAGQKVRPALVVQCDRDNVRLNSTIVAMITRTIHRSAVVDTQFLIDLSTPEGKATGLLATSAVNCSNLFTVQNHLLRRTIGRLSAPLMDQVAGCLKASLDLV